MTDKRTKIHRPKPENARGFRDIAGNYLHRRLGAIKILSEIYQSYGFEALETPVLEYADSLGKFLPDIDRPAGGVFGFKDDDDQWLAMRYDLTAPLARFFAKNAQFLPRPYKRYQVGSVFRNEKPGPGRFREFTQFDADTVDTANIAADSELCLMLSQGLNALGIETSDVKININNRKLLTAVLEISGLAGDDEHITNQRGIALRAIDKLDRLGENGVRLLLGKGRKDESGDFTDGANLSDAQADLILGFTHAKGLDNHKTLNNLHDLVKDSEIGLCGISELEQMMTILDGVSGNKNFILEPSTVRGLGYYTGPVFEAELTFDVPNDKGQIVQFGSVAGGGRYDELVKRFTGQEVPAVGVSIGLDRLLSALEAKNLIQNNIIKPSVLITVMDKESMVEYVKIANQLRQNGMCVDLYVGDAGMKAQMKYADKRNSTLAVIQGSDERTLGRVIVKDLQFRNRYGDNAPDGIEQQIICNLSGITETVNAMLKRGSI
jgi:histidyl-tRNA synthetase